MADTDSKRCPKCNETLPLSAFGRDRQKGLKVYCRPCHNASNKLSRQRNPETSAAATRNWKLANPDRVNQHRANFKEKKPGRMKELVYRWQRNNPERYRSNQIKNRERPEFRLKRTIGSRIRMLVNGKEGRLTVDLVGYGTEELKVHLERQFLPGMTWENYGQWHIDHIIPLSAFNITTLDDPAIKTAWALPNLRPLWAADNRRKHDKRTHLI